MLTAILGFIRFVSIYILYFGGILTCAASTLRKPEWGVFLIAVLIPQPNIWYKFINLDFFMAKDFLDILFIAIVLGIFVNKKGFAKTGNSVPIFLLLIVSYIALWNSTLHFSLPSPFTTANPILKPWKDFAMMICMYFLILNTIKKENQQKTLIILMSLVILFISIRSYRGFTAGASFVEDSRSVGPFWIVGLGANHFGAFMADYSVFFLGLLLFEKNRKQKYLYVVTVLFSLHPLFF
jgi:hypothetical protein